MGFLDLFKGRKTKPQPGDLNSDLVQAMHKVALSDNPDNRRTLYETLLSSTLLIPVPEIPTGLAPGLQKTTGDIELQITGMLDKNNVRVTVAFTDAEALQNWDPNTPYVGIKAQEYFRLVMRMDIQQVVINPFDPIRKMIRPGGRVTRAEAELLANGALPTRVGPTNSQFQLRPSEIVAIGLPANPPNPTIEEQLRHCASTLPEVAELYLCQMATERGGSHTVIGIVADSKASRERENEIVDGLGRSVQKELKRGQALDFLFLRGDLRTQVRERGKRLFSQVSTRRNQE